MSRWHARAPTVWFVAAAALAAFTYLYALDSWGIPSNGDEYVYTHIVRKTAASGQWLPLQSDLPHSANTKPPLLFWQGMVATSWGADWSAWRLRLPGVMYTLATAALALAIVRRLSGDWQRAAVAAVIYLACYATYRYGRPFLTDAPETFWLSLIPAALLATQVAFCFLVCLCFFVLC